MADPKAAFTQVHNLKTKCDRPCADDQIRGRVFARRKFRLSAFG
ncbi:MAG: hypothetical protein U0T81_05050 [Saprospiraceae bacterium]